MKNLKVLNHEEIEFKTPIFYNGNVTVDGTQSVSVSDFVVWVRVAETDIDITKSLSCDELQDAKNDFLYRYDEYLENLKKDSMSAFEIEQERLMAEAENNVEMQLHG